MTDSSARAVAERLFADLATRDADAFVAHFADHAVFELPFPLPGAPSRLDGPAAIREYLARRWADTSTITVHGIHPRIHQTTDPELVIVENDVDMTTPARGRARVRASVNVVRVRDGRVVLFRDYVNTGVHTRIADVAARDR